MKKYLLTPRATVKEKDLNKWWIDRDFIKPFYVKGNNANEALREFVRVVQDERLATISTNALRKKNPIYIDTKKGETIQTGYCITGKTYFDNSERYFDLWIDIEEVTIPKFNNKKEIE